MVVVPLLVAMVFRTSPGGMWFVSLIVALLGPILFIPPIVVP